MYRILVTGMLSGPNGIATSMLNLYRHMDRDRVQLDFLFRRIDRTKDPVFTHKAEIESLGGRIFWASYTTSSYPASARRHLRELFDEHPEIRGVHMCALSMNDVYPAHLAVRRDLPVRIIHCHTGRARDQKEAIAPAFLANQKRTANGNYDRWACSDLSGEYMYGDPPYRIVPNAVDTERFSWNPLYRTAVRKSLDIGEDDPVLGFVGNMYYIKNPRFALRVFREFRKLRPNAKLLLVGTGKDLKDTLDYARKLHVISSVRSTGMQQESQLFYSAMDCMLMPSLSEGLPNAAVEAQACGLPLLISDTVSPMTAITPLVRFLSLKQAPRIWAGEALRATKETRRRSYNKEIRTAGYDIRDTARELTEYYCAKIEGRPYRGSLFLIEKTGGNYYN